MTAGVLIYCFDTEAVKYHPTANFAIAQIKKHLGLPVTVVTDTDTQSHLQGQDNVVLIEPRTNNKRFYNNKSIPWLNLERVNAYEYSPYDVTILMDSDYFVYTDNLLQYINTAYDFLLHDKVYDATGRNSFNYDTKSIIPIVWATVTIFKKSAVAKNIFAMIKHVQKHYDYFCNLYRIEFQNYRNDYAFAIALNQLSGHTTAFIPSAMAMLPSTTEIVKISESGITFKFDKEINLVTQDVHVLNKEIPVNV